MSSCLAAFHYGIPVAHVEAGLRTYNNSQPFPEEANRRIISVISSLNFAPTRRAKSNLISEGVDPKAILITGNTVIDSLFYILRILGHKKDEFSSLARDKRIILVTSHRRENIGVPLRNICIAIKFLADKYRDSIHFIIPVHPNPNVRSIIYKSLANIANISLTDPLDYYSFINVMRHSFLILSDSGGIQEEAPSLAKPVIVLRDTTERTEAIEAGAIKLVGTNPKRIIETTELLLNDEKEYLSMSRATNPFGDGKASKRIVQFLLGKPVIDFNTKKNK
jgi:UDP-N-acetylglucosamine 2-epimerase (non-hydrolysing)